MRRPTLAATSSNIGEQLATYNNSRDVDTGLCVHCEQCGKMLNKTHAGTIRRVQVESYWACNYPNSFLKSHCFSGVEISLFKTILLDISFFLAVSYILMVRRK